MPPNQMIKDWPTMRVMAMDLVKLGYIPVWNEFCPELEEIVTECIFLAKKQGLKEVTLLINSNGGSYDCFNGIRAAMLKSGLKFIGFVMSKARSNGFRLLQVCDKRVALVNSDLQFHWGWVRFDNHELAAIMEDDDWPIARLKERLATMRDDIFKRTGLTVDELDSFALYARGFSSAEALRLNMLDEVVASVPKAADRLNEVSIDLPAGEGTSDI